MSDHEPSGLSRRQLLKTGALLAAAPILGATRCAAAQSPVKSTKVLDFQTAADVTKAEQGGMEECTRWLKGFVKQVPVEFVATQEPFWTVSEKK